METLSFIFVATIAIVVVLFLVAISLDTWEVIRRWLEDK